MLNRIRPDRTWPPRLIRVLTLTTALGLAPSPTVSAAPPDHANNGGNKDNDDDGGSTAYTLTDLGASAPNGWSDATTISDVNSDSVAFVAGDAWTGGDADYAFVWEVDATGSVLSTSSIPPLNGVESHRATAANSEGLVVGRTSISAAQDADGDYVFPAFVSFPDFGNGELPSFTGKRRSYVEGINEAGEIVGAADFAADPDFGRINHGALWHADAETGTISGPIDLEQFWAFDINDDGVMAGELNGEATIAWFDASGELQTMGLGLLSPDDSSSEAAAINNFSEVVGTSREPVYDNSGAIEGFTRTAFLWTSEKGMTALGAGFAVDINDDQQIVGESSAGSGTNFVALWSNGVMFDLNDLIDAKHVHLLHCGGINNAGQIVGLGRFGKRRDRENHGFMLTPNAS